MKYILTSAFLLLFGFTISAQTLAAVLPEDMPVNHSIFRMNSELQYNSILEDQLRREIDKNPHWKALIATKRMSVGLVDFSNMYNPQFASINGDHMMYAASLPKIAVLLAAMDGIEKGTLKDTKEVRQDMWLMISKSNNQATTRMIDRVGFENISKVVQDPRYNLYDISNGGGLWVGKRYAAQGKRNPDPLKGLSHAATVNSVLRFYKLLAYGELVSQDRSKEMLKIMMDPSLHHKFVNTLDKVNPDAKVFRKSGSWKQFHSDSAIVWGEDGRKYILVALIEDESGGAVCKDLVKSVEKIIVESKDQVSIH